MSDLVGNPEDRFSRVAAQFIWVCFCNALFCLSIRVDVQCPQATFFHLCRDIATALWVLPADTLRRYIHVH